MFQGLSGGNTSHPATVTPGPGWPPGTPPASGLPAGIPEALLDLLPDDPAPDDPSLDDPVPDDPLPELPPPSDDEPELLPLWLEQPFEKARATAVPTVSGQTRERPRAVDGRCATH